MAPSPWLLLLLLLLMMMLMMMTCRYKPATEDQLMKAFQTLDTEDQGYLTQEQLSKLMMEEGKLTLYRGQPVL